MNRTLDDILSLARLGRPSEGVTEVDVAALVDAVVEDFRDLGADVDFAEGPRITLHVRPTLLRRAIRNLIENAIKYAGAAEVSIRDAPRRRFDLDRRSRPRHPDRLEAVFDPFTRLEGSRNRDTGGLGLGLALARAIVREAGGEIVLANRTGGGLEATITLPRAGTSGPADEASGDGDACLNRRQRQGRGEASNPCPSCPIAGSVSARLPTA